MSVPYGDLLCGSTDNARLVEVYVKVDSVTTAPYSCLVSAETLYSVSFVCVTRFVWSLTQLNGS